MFGPALPAAVQNSQGPLLVLFAAPAVHHIQPHAQRLLTDLWPLPLPTGARSAALECPAAPAALLAAGGAPPPPPASRARHGDVNNASKLHPVVRWTEAVQCVCLLAHFVEEPGVLNTLVLARF